MLKSKMSNKVESIIEIHNDYIFLLIILFFSFGLCGYFFHHVTKSIKKDQNISQSINAKHKILHQLTLANFFRCFSLVYIIITRNTTGDDIASFINLIFHLIPSLLFISLLFSYIQFFIEKFYEIKKKNIVFFAPSIKFFSFLIFIFLFVVTVSCLITKKYNAFFCVTNGVLMVLCLLLGILYVYYGVCISNFYSKLNVEPSDKSLLNKRLLLIICFVGFGYTLRGIICFLIVIGIMKENSIDVNVYDFLWMLINELISGAVIGYTKGEKKRDPLMFEIEKFDFDPNGNNGIYNGKPYKATLSLIDGINTTAGGTNNKGVFKELEDPLLEQFEIDDLDNSEIKI